MNDGSSNAASAQNNESATNDFLESNATALETVASLVFRSSSSIAEYERREQYAKNRTPDTQLAKSRTYAVRLRTEQCKKGRNATLASVGDGVSKRLDRLRAQSQINYGKRGKARARAGTHLERHRRRGGVASPCLATLRSVCRELNRSRSARAQAEHFSRHERMIRVCLP